MSLIDTHKQWVLDTVDRLRQRKARPDLDRISRMVERFHGLTHAETKESLDKLCEEGVVLKVHFKGNISYRHIRNYDNSFNSQNSLIYNTSSRIVNAISTIMKETGDGVSFQDLEHWLISKNPDTRLVKHRLNNALQREITRGNVTKLPDNCYVLTESLPKEKSRPEHPRREVKAKEKIDKLQASTDKKGSTQTTAQPKYESKPKDKVTKKSTSMTAGSMVTQSESRSDVKVREKLGKLSTSSLEKSMPANESKESSPTKEQPRRGRPLSKRKRFKKTHGPDFENPLELKKGTSKEKSEEKEETPVCDFCTLSAATNTQGKPEPLLVCIECNAKAHPSCMEYSPELAERALNSPWQCMECKMCAVCGLDGLENSEVMLFCDACDRGYHMTCHRPPLTSKPKGKWICSECKTEMNKDTANDQKLDELQGSKKRGRKRKMGSPASPLSLKCPKPEHSQMNGALSEGTGVGDYTGNGGSNDTACLPTPSASPRPGDTFDYEMKMSLAGLTFPSTEDPTTYSDATDWVIEDVVKFFQECGFEKEAQCFADQEIDGKSLLLLRREDVLTGLGLKLGPAVKIYKKIVRLQQISQLVVL